MVRLRVRVMVVKYGTVRGTVGRDGCDEVGVPDRVTGAWVR